MLFRSTADYNVTPAGKRTTGKRLESTPPHDDRMSESELLEPFEIGRDVEGLVTSTAYGAITRHNGYHAYHRRLHHTETFPLIAGHGS